MKAVSNKQVFSGSFEEEDMERGIKISTEEERKSKG